MVDVLQSNASARLTGYSWGDDPGLRQPQRGQVSLTGDDGMARALGFKLASLDVSKNLGEVGSWTARLVGLRDGPDLLDILADGDWIDSVFTLADQQVLAMRGPVMSRRRSRSSRGRSWVISGADHVAAWEQAQVWWNPIANTDLGSGLRLAEILASANRLGASPFGVTHTFLTDVFTALAVKGLALTALPPGLPNATDSFVDTVALFDEFTALPDRIGFATHQYDLTGSSLWQHAVEWSDPSFALLHGDLVKKDRGGVIYPLDPQGPKDLTLGAIHRDRPFPTDADATGQNGTGEQIGNADRSAWWTLPQHDVEDVAVLNEDVGSSGEERSNAFYTPPAPVGGPVTLGLLYNPISMARHGMRKLEAPSKYVSPVSANAFGSSLAMRIAQRDWFCLNHLFTSGTITIAGGRPQIRCGDRLRVLTKDPANTTTYYVEGVAHSFVAPGSLTTTVTVTRGFRNMDRDYLPTLRTEAANYRDSARVGAPATPPVSAGVG